MEAGPLLDIDVVVTWRLADGSTLDLPATVCFRDTADSPETRAEAARAAIEVNIADFPDDIGEEATPISLRFIDRD